MGTLLRLPPALLAVLPLVLGPAAWAMDCGCDTRCGTVAEATVCACRPTGCDTCCDTTGPAAEGCGCGCEPVVPLAPAVPTTESVFVPAAVPPAPFPSTGADAKSVAGRDVREPDPAASPPVRVRLCVWRN